MKKRIMIICTFLIIVFMVGCNTQINEIDDTIKETSDIVEENIEVIEYILENGRLALKLTNNNEVSINLEIEAVFYDEGGRVLDGDVELVEHMGTAETTAVMFYSTPEEFDHYEIFLDTGSTFTTSCKDEVDVKIFNSDEKITIQVKNTNGNNMDFVKVAVAYYENNKMIGLKEMFKQGIENEKSANIIILHPFDKDLKVLKYDDYEIFIKEATLGR